MSAVTDLCQERKEQLWAELSRRAQAWLLMEVEPMVSPRHYLQHHLERSEDLQSFTDFIDLLDSTAVKVFDGLDWPDRQYHEASGWPAKPSAHRHTAVPMLLSKLAFGDGSSPRGAPNLCDVIDIVDNNFTKGAKTAKYPLEIFPLSDPAPGTQIQAYSVGQLVGVGTTAASFLCVWALANVEKWWPLDLSVPAREGSWSPGVAPSLMSLLQLGGPHLSSIWRLHATWQPFADTLDLIQSSLGAKIAATSRQRPHPVQMMRALELRVKELAVASARKSNLQIWEAAISEFQRKQSRAHKLTTDETAAIRLLARSDPKFVEEVGKIWSLEKMCYTCLPLNLISAKFLLEETDTGADPISNPMWFKIFTVTEEKKWWWLQRVRGRFNAKVAQWG